MLTFADYIASQPGLSQYAIDMYLMIDQQAQSVGAAIAARDISPREYRALADTQERRGLGWLAGKHRERADALETDVRLAAIPSLRAWAAAPDGIGNSWINWYVTLLHAHIEAMNSRDDEDLRYHTEMTAAE